MILNDWLDLQWAGASPVSHWQMRDMRRHVRREYDPVDLDWQFAANALSGMCYAAAGAAIARAERARWALSKIHWKFSALHRLSSARKTSDLLWRNAARGSMSLSACDTRQRICRAAANLPWHAEEKLQQAEEAVDDGLTVIRHLSSPVCYTHVFFLIARADILLRRATEPINGEVVEAVHDATHMAHAAEILTNGKDARAASRMRRHARAFRHLGILYARAERPREAGECLERAAFFEDVAAHMPWAG